MGRPGTAGVRLIPAAANPLGVELWDCRPFTHNTISTTGNADIARSFVELRKSQGAEHRGHAPASARVISSDLTYALGSRPPEGPLCKALEMEDKWDIYLFGDSLYFARSWTGELDYLATVDFHENEMHVSAIAVAGHQDLASAPRVVDFLVKSLLLGREVPHPLPADLPPTPEQVALFSFHMYGRRCSFGTYVDTMALQPPVLS